MVALNNELVADQGRRPGLVERLWDEAKFLAAEDQRMVHLLLNGRLSQREVAQLLGLSQSALCRRIRRIWERLNDPLVKTLIAQRQALRPEFWQLGIEHFLQGLSGPELAEKHRIPPYKVRQVLAMIQGWFNGRQSFIRGQGAGDRGQSEGDI